MYDSEVNQGSLVNFKPKTFTAGFHETEEKTEVYFRKKDLPGRENR